MPGTTPSWYLPYPYPTDPVAQGAADIRALAEALEQRLERIRNMSLITTFYGMGVGPLDNDTITPVPLNAIIDQIGAAVPGQPLRICPPAARGNLFVISFMAMFQGATGDGGVKAQIMPYDAAGVSQGQMAYGFGPMNGAVTLAAVFARGAPDMWIQVEVAAHATGTSHQMNWGLVGITPIGLAVGGAGPGLIRDALELELPEPLPAPTPPDVEHALPALPELPEPKE